ncbi:sucrase-6-phosphate hydrolase [Alkalihalobacillus alcalophilus ATCC 27647 = CGMCC 1.3604]|uniref:Sucrose-6-phosphate hydrolase n=1 Tax=Alkalihalobacillus alcalophilus ATCC 27647 = CGMCC 1.3604 TaxID=1218173 RepID=A0A094YQN4_ALKAL|nr:sucrose-6-phosphate hydrolase [Alkalihalobacillus alcalophilus]KGA95737.1 sucrose-6-phosphate hydrolase [Alkalihalobacillus alcalophilus ATCC 27647 = CGMCC 1.3604]MED1564134.1 sucrose-6-phosphate hydrolase [Alkalihalobacillus alcalophilus]THG89493.1 sucrase-6-phosphate hydrolase [Alkalihalobacillus alcalophilus ATCC 27647 = CGMCC 1.3604]
MTSKDEQLRTEADEEVKKHQELVQQDPYRLRYHLMPPVGLLNDPNGWIQWKGTFHLFYQWMPFKTDHGAKFWGHYSSEDLVNWNHEKIALTPSEWFEKNGCYSGSAIEHEGRLYLFYTGNVKGEKGNRETYQCLAVSEDGLDFQKEGPVVRLPDGYTSHFRDPKVWQQKGRFFMVIGAQTTELKGAVVLFSSSNLRDWKHEGILIGGGRGRLSEFGYMFECPDMFTLDGRDVLVFSPQGLEPKGMNYLNVYQAGYVVGSFDPETGQYDHDDFHELDHGFDFYAPQTTEDEAGRRIMFAWMSVPDQDEQAHPTIAYRWLHNMTLPRELKLIGGEIWQLPVLELEQLRIGAAIIHNVQLDEEHVELAEVNGKALELLIDDITVTDGWWELTIGGAVRLLYSKGVFTLERKSYVDGAFEKRQCEVEQLSSLHIFIDTSSIEIFVNGGRKTLTARFYPLTNDDSIRFGTNGFATFLVHKWRLGTKKMSNNNLI